MTDEAPNIGQRFPHGTVRSEVLQHGDRCDTGIAFFIDSDVSTAATEGELHKDSLPKRYDLGGATPRPVKEVSSHMGCIKFQWGEFSCEVPGEVFLILLVKLIS